MSHVVGGGLVAHDIAALRCMAKLLGLEWKEGQTTHRWFGRFVGDAPLPVGYTEADLGKCLHAMRVPGNPHAYELGVVKRKNGPGYDLMWDNWQGGYGLEEKIGKNGENLKQAYAVACGMVKAQRGGFIFNKRTLPNGKVMISLEK